ncbi:MAG: hypothetical protein MUF49_27620, partial [Oculatellaceae cyanobacterium Prado106]|nr:hypothetical protein [Oculatellaceae cyanobacterium Prado106]
LIISVSLLRFLAGVVGINARPIAALVRDFVRSKLESQELVKKETLNFDFSVRILVQLDGTP